MKADNAILSSTHIRIRQPLGFLAAGGLATSAHWLTMGILMQAGMSALIATAIGFLVGAVANYLLQRRLAFLNARRHRSAVPRYLLSCAIAWLTNIAIFDALHQVAIWPPAIAQLVTTLCVAALNYALYKRLVFHE
ncbi:GtrA family protein [Marinobacter sp. BGYM27]|uniref:GtrA family protein n=1 Tax=unclassified Marinobacter TaxID=83889 RepID=UPI0021A4FC85|nr:GtrA family protein [Marinobacter sp. BGYM27]MDG5500934.1 GtrA family protein [Marinobacter sp. BGYM27]